LELALGGLVLSLSLLRRHPDSLVLSGSAQRDGDWIQEVTRVESGRGARSFATTRAAVEVAAALDEHWAMRRQRHVFGPHLHFEVRVAPAWTATDPLHELGSSSRLAG
jgi:hypothetical protein